MYCLLTIKKALRAMAGNIPLKTSYGKTIMKADGGGVGAPGSYAPTTNTTPKDDVKNQMDTAPSDLQAWMSRIYNGHYV